MAWGLESLVESGAPLTLVPGAIAPPSLSQAGPASLASSSSAVVSSRSSFQGFGAGGREGEIVWLWKYWVGS